MTMTPKERQVDDFHRHNARLMEAIAHIDDVIDRYCRAVAACESEALNELDQEGFEVKANTADHISLMREKCNHLSQFYRQMADEGGDA